MCIIVFILFCTVYCIFITYSPYLPLLKIMIQLAFFFMPLKMQLVTHTMYVTLSRIWRTKYGKDLQMGKHIWFICIFLSFRSSKKSLISYQQHAYLYAKTQVSIYSTQYVKNSVETSRIQHQYYILLYNILGTA
jgi:hypothetical protein